MTASDSGLTSPASDISTPEREVGTAADERPPVRNKPAFPANRAEELLCQEQERLAFVLEAAGMIAWDWNPLTDELCPSENAGRVLRLPADVTVRSGKELIALVHFQDRERAHRMLRTAAGAADAQGEEFRVVRGDGSVMWVAGKGKASAAGKPGFRSGVLIDITRSRQAEEHIHGLNITLRRCVEELRVTLDVLPVGIFFADDPSCLSIRANRVGAAMLGIPMDRNASKTGPEGEHLPFLILQDGVEVPAENLPLQQATRTGMPVMAVEIDVVRGDGSVIRLLEYATPLFDENGMVRGAVGTFFDITARRCAEEVQRERLEELQAVVEGSPVGIAVAEDAACRRIRVNSALCKLLQIPEGANASLSAPLEELPAFRFCQGGRDVPVEKLPMQSCIALAAPVDGMELELIRPDGTSKVVLNNVRPLFDAAGKVRGCVNICTDITDRKSSEEMRKQADRRKDEFLATLAHELRNPLAPIRNSVELFREKGTGNPELNWARDVIDRQLRQLTRLVDDLLDVSRITRGKIELRKERIALSTLVEHALETSRPFIGAARHELRVSLPEEPLWLDADPTRLGQVLSNLLNNAAKYTPAGGTIALTAERAGGDVVLKVQDNGTGIRPEMLSSIFDMFTQVDVSLERAQGGLGIGLTIAKRLVEMHGGAITAGSAGLGQGSEFTVRLSLAEMAMMGGPPLAERAHPTRRPTCRILIADDNHDAVDTLAMLLQASGNDVLVAYDGLEAVRAAEEHRPELILLDIGMPGMNGYDVARELRQRSQTRDALLVAMTGWGQENDRQRSKEAGFDHHLVKPLNLDALEALLSCLSSQARPEKAGPG